MKNTPPFRLADLRRLWMDDSRTNAQIAAEIGYSAPGLRSVARRLGLPPRRLGPKSRIDRDLLVRLWTAGVGKREIAAHFGVDRSTLCYTAQLLGLPKRPSGFHPLMTLAQFNEAELGRLMADAARIEAAAMRNAEMVDCSSAFVRLTRRAA